MDYLLKNYKERDMGPMAIATFGLWERAVGVEGLWHKWDECRYKMEVLGIVKKILSVLFLALILAVSPSLATETQAQQPIEVVLDGLKVDFDVLPVIQDGRTLVPFRAIAEAMHVNVSWDGQNRVVKATNSDIAVLLQIDSHTAYCNNTPIMLDVAPQIIDGRTLIPVRFFTEQFNCRVNWDSNLYRADISSPSGPMAFIGFYALGDSKTSSWTNLFGQPYPLIARGNTDIISELALGWYSIDQQGNLLDKSRTGWQRPEGWETVLEKAQEYRLLNEMVIHVTDSDRTIAALLDDPLAIDRAVKAISGEAPLYDGVNLDFEGLGYNDKGEELKKVQEKFTRFVTLLSKDLQRNGINLTVTLHAPNSAYKGYDYNALGKVADRIIIMAYDYGPKPEPVDKVKQAVEMARKMVPAQKLVLGISIPSENTESIATKIGIAKKYNLEGIALWRLGLVSDDIWQVLRSSLTADR